MKRKKFKVQVIERWYVSVDRVVYAEDENKAKEIAENMGGDFKLSDMSLEDMESYIIDPKDKPIKTKKR